MVAHLVRSPYLANRLNLQMFVFEVCWGLGYSA